MATQLINDMTRTWKPEKYHDQTHEVLVKWLKQKTPKKVKEKTRATKSQKKEDVIDMMTLLKQSLRKKASPKRHKNK